MMTSDDPDAPTIAPIKSTTENRNNLRTDNNNRSRTSNNSDANSTQQVQHPRYVYSGGNGPGGNNAIANHPGTSEGNTTGTGDRGVPGGTPGAANYTGSPGNGTGGISHTLSGRDISPKQFVAEFNEGGKVVVRVKVDRNGNIISKNIKSSPNRALSNIALQKLSQAKFSANPDAAPEQIGDVTFVFKTRAQ
jgi:TonB family protein